MNTNCIVLQQAISKTPIELCLRFEPNNNGFVLSQTTTGAENWENLVLICLKYHGEFDLIYAYTNVITEGLLYLGHWNDGFVKEKGGK